MASTLKASKEGIELVDNARRLKGWAKKSQVLADLAATSKATLGRFWAGVPIQSDTFKAICKAFEIEKWEDVADLTVPVSQASRLRPQSTKRLTFAIAGSIEETDKRKLDAMVALLNKLGGDTSIEIVDIEEGSIKLILGGTPEALKRIEQMYRAGELTEILGVAIQDVAFNEDPNSIEIKQNSSIFDQLRLFLFKLLRPITTRLISLDSINLQQVDLSGENFTGASFRRADLSGANLSAANLRRANLSGVNLFRSNLIKANLRRADLNGANLREAALYEALLLRSHLREANLREANLQRANLSGADLYRANLFEANLSEANLFGANLREANLGEANLRQANLANASLTGANLSNADVREARFGTKAGLSQLEKLDLVARGAIQIQN